MDTFTLIFLFGAPITKESTGEKKIGEFVRDYSALIDLQLIFLL